MCIVIIFCPVYAEELKELLTWNKKHFSSYLKGFQLSEIVSDAFILCRENDA